ncbi:MAG: GerAB/ArcD/ProY family transporter [Bacillota bacterium]
MIQQQQKQHQITSFQLIFIVAGIQIGVGILSLYRVTFEAGAGTDAWMGVLLAWFIAQIAIFLIVHLCSIFPEDSLIDYSSKILGRVLGWLLSFTVLGYFLGAAAIISRTFAEVLQVWTLQKTPIPVLISLTLIPSLYLILLGIKAFARFAMVILLLTWWLLLTLVIPLKQGDILNMLPIGHAPLPGIISAALATSLAMIGYELILLFYPFIDRKRDVLLSASIGNGLTGLAYIFNVVTAAIFFSPADVPNQMWPSLQLLKVIQFSFLQRVESIVLSFWLLLVVVTVAGYYWASAFSLYKLINMKSFKLSAVVMAPIIFIVSLLPRDINQVTDIGDKIGTAGLILSFSIPILLLTVRYLKKWRSK